MGILKNRMEFLFIYDVKDANPNGDPLDENKPRLDEETGQIIVTDVRLKRTIRDYLFKEKGLDVFIVEQRKEDGNLRTKEERSADFKDDPEKILKSCIDMRLFGATTAIKGKTKTWVGPVQFKFGRSLHRVNGPILVKGTTVMPSGAEKKQGTFREEWIVPYALISFYGVANENAAEATMLQSEDIDLLIEGMWKGTKNLITRSKFGQMPRLLLNIVYKQGESFYIGELDRRIKWSTDKREEEIRDIVDGVLDISELLNEVMKNKEKIEKVRIIVDERISVEPDIVDNLMKILGKEKLQKLDIK